MGLSIRVVRPSGEFTGLRSQPITRSGLLLITIPGRPTKFTSEFCSGVTTCASPLDPNSSRRHLLPPGQPHSCSDCASCTKFQDGLVIFQDLVFVICKDVDDICFRMELLDKRGKKILQMLSTMQGPRHSLDHTSSAPATSVALVL